MKQKMRVKLGKEATEYLFYDKEDYEDFVEINPHWIDHGPAPLDVITLLLNIFHYKLNVEWNLKSANGMVFLLKYFMILVFNVTFQNKYFYN